MKKEKNTTLAVRDKLTTALSSINEQLSKFEAISTAKHQTNGQFSWNPNYTGGGNSIDVHKCTDLMLLLSIYTSLRTKNRDYVETVEEIKLDEYPNYSWQGHTWEQWKQDLAIRIMVVNKEKAITKLKSQKDILSKHLSEDEQLAATLNELGFDA